MAKILPKMSFADFLQSFEQSRIFKECMTVGKIQSIVISGNQCKIMIGDTARLVKSAFEITAHGEQFVIGEGNKQEYIGQYVLLSYIEKTGRLSFHYFTPHRELLVSDDSSIPFPQVCIDAFEASVDEDNIRFVSYKKSAGLYKRTLIVLRAFSILWSSRRRKKKIKSSLSVATVMSATK